MPIPVKAKLDGEYVDRMSFGFDAKCFVGTNVSVTKNAGMVEGKSNSWNLNSLSKNQFMRLNKPKKNARIKKIS